MTQYLLVSMNVVCTITLPQYAFILDRLAALGVPSVESDSAIDGASAGPCPWAWSVRGAVACRMSACDVSPDSPRSCFVRSDVAVGVV